MSRLVFDETLLQGSTEERVAKALALKKAGCIILKRSITTVARGWLDPSPGLVPAGKAQKPPTNQEFIHRCYAQVGIHLSDLAHLQRNGMRKDIAWLEANPGDLICFALAHEPNKHLNGIVSDQRTVIYAGKRRTGVFEQTFEALQTAELIGIRRMLPPNAQRKTDVIRLPDRAADQPQLEPTTETVRCLIQANLEPPEASAA